MKLMTTAFPIPLGSEKLPFLLLKLTSLTCKLICLRERYSKKGLIGNTKKGGQNLGRNLSLMLRVWLLKSELTMETINMPSGWEILWFAYKFLWFPWSCQWCAKTTGRQSYPLCATHHCVNESHIAYFVNRNFYFVIVNNWIKWHRMTKKPDKICANWGWNTENKFYYPSFQNQ